MNKACKPEDIEIDPYRSKGATEQVKPNSVQDFILKYLKLWEESFDQAPTCIG